MKSERRILQDRVEAIAIKRCGIKAQEGVRGEKQEHKERGTDQSLNTQHPGTQAIGQIAAEESHCGAKGCEDQGPEQHGAFMVSPGACELIDERFGAVGVRRHERQGKVRYRKRIDKSEKGD